ncbi:hypothetical protein [Cryobacterium sp. Y82]|uniref:hypothetical protein n=1 Tax=Cryobacterium sp. Y82 TaxID=2045017 RepID=UPI001304DD28|nr:hypothetical protein [Cryobacterium sp. Y82]
MMQHLQVSRRFVMAGPTPDIDLGRDVGDPIGAPLAPVMNVEHVETAVSLVSTDAAI